MKYYVKAGDKYAFIDEIGRICLADVLLAAAFEQLEANIVTQAIKFTRPNLTVSLTECVGSDNLQWSMPK